MNRPGAPCPQGLIDALDRALEAGTRLPEAAINGVLHWLHATIMLNVDSHVAFSVDEMVLIAHALGDAAGAPIHEIDSVPHVELSPPSYPPSPSPYPRDTSAVLPRLLKLDNAPGDPKIADFEAALRTMGFMEAECCGASVGLVNPQAFEVGEIPYHMQCVTCGSTFEVQLVDGKKALVRKADA